MKSYKPQRGANMHTIEVTLQEGEKSLKAKRFDVGDDWSDDGEP